jgi:hypothetical protein
MQVPFTQAKSEKNVNAIHWHPGLLQDFVQFSVICENCETQVTLLFITYRGSTLVIFAEVGALDGCIQAIAECACSSLFAAAGLGASL